MTSRLIGILLSVCVEWSLVGDDWNLIGATALPVETVKDATPEPRMAPLIQQRKAAYRRAREAAERDGKAVYRSDGKPGDALPKGMYELIRQDDGEIYYREVEPAGIPIPKPDPAVIWNFRTTEECVT